MASVNTDKLVKYLATAQDWSLSEHDRKYHPNGYKQGDSCSVRDKMGRKDKSDDNISVSARRPDSKKASNASKYLNLVGKDEKSSDPLSLKTEDFDGVGLHEKLKTVLPDWEEYIFDAIGGRISEEECDRVDTDEMLDAIKDGIDAERTLGEALNAAADVIVGNRNDTAVKEHTRIWREMDERV